jgi:predicted secreted protein
MPISGGLWNVGPAVRTRAPRPANSSTCTYAQLASCQAGQVYMYIVHAQGRAAAAVVAFVPSGAGVHVHVVVAFGRLSVVYAPVWYAT